jgi:hypothetical protein
MGFRRFRLRIDRLLVMAMREVGMVRRFLVRAGFMVLGRFFMMTRGVLVMFGGFLVMVCCLF